jgi:hypothetical protein
MTVPLLFGWETVAVGLVVLVVLAFAAVALMAAGRSTSGRSEFEAWLASRSDRQARGSGVEA